MTEPTEFRHTTAAEDWATSTERTEIFSVVREVPNEDGEGTHEERQAYTMPTKPNAGLTLIYLKKARESADLALSWLIETAVGEEGYLALADEFSNLSGDEVQTTLAAIGGKIQKVALGGLEAPKG